MKITAIVTYPEDPDALTEGSLTLPIGAWTGGAVETEFLAAVGSYCLRNAAGGGSMWFTFNSPVDLSMFDRLFLYCALAPDPYGNDTIGITLSDVAGRMILRELYISPVKVWQTVDLSLAEGWTGDVATFDWKQLQEIFISVPGTNFVYVDYLHFRGELIRPTLRILSVPTGKHYTINGVSGYTPASYGLDAGATYTVTMDAEGFREWEDGSTDPTREVSITEDTTITAYYEEAPPPPPSIEDVAMVLGVVSSVIAIVGVIYSAWTYYTGS